MTAEFLVTPRIDGTPRDPLTAERLVMCYVPDGAKPGLDVEAFETMEHSRMGTRR